MPRPRPAGPRAALAALGLALTLAATACGADAAADTHAAPSHPTHPATHAAAPKGGTKISRAAFHADMRKLWEDHVTWTRLYIVSAVAGLPDLQATAGRLLQNEDDIGHAIATFYGAQ